MTSDADRDHPPKSLPNPPALDEGNIPGPPTAPGVILVVMAILAGLGLLYIASATAPSVKNPQTPVSQSMPQPS